ncbi:SCO family protein [Rhodopila sp.]|uniref:SCO family protein n=1 Tax=Rhodopila sp. TaxID=2480087 RepID=UPI003D144CBB
MKRREALRLLAAGAATASVPRVARAEDGTWHDIDVTGSSPSLSFTMQATPDGRTVTQADYHGLVTMLYFGYTFCPDACPLTMQNVANALDKTGDAAKQIRFLFVTVDPGRDTLPVLKNYVGLFAPGFVGLRGSADELERLAKRFRIAYSVTPSADPRQYQVTHSSAIYVFDRQGNARLLVPSMASQTPDIDGVAADLTRLTTEKPSWFDWLRSQV